MVPVSNAWRSKTRAETPEAPGRPPKASIGVPTSSTGGRLRLQQQQHTHKRISTMITMIASITTTMATITTTTIMTGPHSTVTTVVTREKRTARMMTMMTAQNITQMAIPGGLQKDSATARITNTPSTAPTIPYVAESEKLVDEEEVELLELDCP